MSGPWRTWRPAIRQAFVSALTRLAARDERIILLTGDLGFTVVEPFAEQFPSRFINVGVAEQNMLGIATGLAEAGYIPFAYSIATFATLRPLEFFRNGAALHRFPVRVIGIGAGFEYGTAGFSHHAVEDVAVMRALDTVRVIAPADGMQAAAALEQTWALPEPIYYRVSKNDRLTIPALQGRFRPGRVELLADGGQVLVLTLGAASIEGERAVSKLGEGGIAAGWGIVADVGPASTDALLALLMRYRHVATVEAHVASGGLSAFVAELIAEHRLDCQLIRCGAQTQFLRENGSEAYLMRRHGLTGEQIATRIHAVLDRTA
ncbi:MAG: transketolase C-terminal domain-containing protein [Chloroflexota bacterium]